MVVMQQYMLRRFKKGSLARFCMKQSYLERIGYSGDIKDISKILCDRFDIGKFQSNTLITTGYEDVNILLSTTTGKFLVKIFSNFRSDADCRRYVDVMQQAIKEGVHFPPLVISFEQVKVNAIPLRLCVLSFVEGKTFFELNEKPSKGEIRYLAHQAAGINTININPNPVYDHWAIVNFKKEFEEKKQYLDQSDLTKLEKTLQEFQSIDLKSLPHCFVHGDIIAPNVVRDKENQLWIIDFAVSNYYPRIVELAVLACGLLFDCDTKSKTAENLFLALKEYQKTILLTKQELDALPTFIKVAHCMHVLLASYEKKAKKNTSQENEYYLQLGRVGLEQTE
jgi:Ser/Thr protein kinase RdoA (MazF antagonist)